MNTAITDTNVPLPTRTTAGSLLDPTDVLTAESAAAIIATAQRCAEDPLFEEWVRAVEEYRSIHNTVPEAD